MIRVLVAIVATAIASALLGIGALAHGDPTIRVEPSVVQPGGTITVTGTDMPTGTEFVITLERLGRSIELGRAVTEGEDEGGFTATLTLPATVAPGTHTVHATSASGRSAKADVTVTDGATVAASGGAAMLMPTAALHELDRTKTGPELAVAIVAIVALAAVGARSLRAAA